MVNLVIETPLTVASAAALLGVHRRTIEAWFAAGLDRCKIGRRVYTTREALQRFARHSQQATSAIQTTVDDRPLRQRRRDARAATKEVERRWGLARTRKMETITDGREAGQS